jgi:hypothetical protein
MNPLRLLMVPLRLAAFAVVALAALPGCAGAEAGGAGRESWPFRRRLS